jgi:HSP20 family protein
MHQLLHDLVLAGEPGVPTAWIPAVDVHETDKGYTLKFDLPGVKPEDVTIEAVSGMLTVKGERKAETLEGSNRHRVERLTGSFERSFRMRERIDADAITAGYRDGVLTIEVPKAAEAVKREIKIQVG